MDDGIKYKLRCRIHGILITTRPEIFDVVWSRLFNPKTYPIDMEDEKNTYIRPLAKACKVCIYYDIEKYPNSKDCKTCGLFTKPPYKSEKFIESYRDYKRNLKWDY